MNDDSIYLNGANADLYTVDNIFVRNTDDGRSEATLTDDVLLGDYLLEFPEFFGAYPSSSPTTPRVPTSPPTERQERLPANILAQRGSPTSSSSSSSKSTQRHNYFSLEYFSTIFGSSCPSLSFLQENSLDQTQYRNPPIQLDASPIVATLEKLLPFRSKKNNQGLTVYREGGEEQSMSTLEALSTWMIVSLGLGAWFLVLFFFKKKSTAHSIRKPDVPSKSKSKTKSASSQGSRYKANQSSTPNLLPPPSLEQEDQEAPSANIVDTRNLLDVPAGNLEDPTIAIDSESESVAHPTNHTNANPSKDKDGKSSIRVLQHVFSEDPIHVSDQRTTNSTNDKAKSLARPRSFKEENVNEIIHNEEGEERAHQQQQKQQHVSPELLPMVTIMSDISMSTGLSLSKSSSWSEEIVVTDDDSLEVLAADDIYTGKPYIGNASASMAMKTIATEYLSYCLEESETDCSSCETTQDSQSGSTLLISSSESLENPSRHEEQSHNEGDRSADMIRMEAPSDNMTLPHTSSEIGGNTPEGGDDYARQGNRGEWKRTNQFAASNNVMIMSLCDDSNTTIDLLADSDGSESSSIEYAPRIDLPPHHLSSSPERLKYSRYASDALMRKRKLETYAMRTAPKEPFAPNDNGETGSGNETQSSDDTKENPAFGNSDSTSQNFGSAQPMTKDLEALLLDTDPDCTSRTSSHKLDVVEQNERQLFPEQNGFCCCCLRIWEIYKKKAFWGKEHCQRIAVVLSCLAIIVSVLLCVAMGIAELFRSQRILEFQFHDLEDKITNGPFAAFDEDGLYGFLGELDRQRQQLNQAFDGHCPTISSNLCKSNSISFSSCDTESVPLGDIWKDWFAASGEESPNTEYTNSTDSLFRWFINTRDDSMGFISAQREKLQNEFTNWTWGLSIAFTMSILMEFLAIGILLAIVYPIIKDYFGDSQKEKQPYLQFGRQLSSNDNKCRFSFCTKRVFAITFWSLFVASWLLGMACTIMMVVTLNMCGSGEPNGVVGNLLDRWEEAISNDDVPITEFWKQKLRYCWSSPSPSEQSDLVPIAIEDRIQVLSNLVGPTQILAEELQNLSSSGIYEDVCGREVSPVLLAAYDMGSQVCSDVEFVGSAYLELTSCDHSSWLPESSRVLEETICTRGLKAFTWTFAMQISILLFAAVVWTFRSVFLILF